MNNKEFREFAADIRDDLQRIMDGAQEIEGSLEEAEEAREEGHLGAADVLAFFSADSLADVEGGFLDLRERLDRLAFLHRVDALA